MKPFLRDNGLTIALTAMFLASIVGMILAGHTAHNDDLARHGRSAIGIAAYISTGEFLSAVLENWESEFLQMSVFVVLTAMLFQRGSAESRDPDSPDRPRDELPLAVVGRRPVLSWFYSHSLGLVFGLLFVASFLLHWRFSALAANERAQQHGGEIQSVGAHLFDPQLWFESFQNWQSEFLSTAILVVLSIFLRYRGSPESKAVGAENRETGA